MIESNIQTLGAKSPEKAKKIIEETLRNFVPLSIYLKIKIPTIFLDIQIDIQKKISFRFKDTDSLFSPIFESDLYPKYIQSL